MSLSSEQSDLVRDLRDERDWQGECFRDGTPLTPCPGYLERAADTIEVLSAELERVREALEPSGSTKAAYHGEFSFQLYRGVSDAGIDQHEKVYVPWDTVKEIMAAILARASLTQTPSGDEA